VGLPGIASDSAAWRSTLDSSMMSAHCRSPAGHQAPPAAALLLDHLGELQGAIRRRLEATERSGLPVRVDVGDDALRILEAE